MSVGHVGPNISRVNRTSLREASPGWQRCSKLQSGPRGKDGEEGRSPVGAGGRRTGRAMATLRHDGRLLQMKIQPRHLVLCCKAMGGQRNLTFPSHQPAFPKVLLKYRHCESGRQQHSLRIAELPGSFCLGTKSRERTKVRLKRVCS